MGSKSAIGIGNGICFKQVRDKGGGSYIDPLVRDSIVGLWKFDQNTNESPTRNIIKNTIKDKGGDLELLNFGYKLNSGYGKYIEDFSLFTLSNRFEYSEISNTKVTITAVLNNSTGIYHSVTEEDSALYWNTFKIKVSGSTDDVYIRYTTAKKSIRLYNGINTVVVPNDLSWHSFTASATNVSCNITLEFVPEYEGALVTDGKDDMIVSQKTVQEMLGGSNVCTVVSMIHQINLSADVNTSINNIRSESVAHVCARHLNTAYGKTGIFGYSKQLNTTSNPTLINNILGDKKDYIADGNSVIDTTDKYFVQGYKYNDSLYELSEVAVYWTFISNKVLTTDEINQIIGYFKLDKYVTPQVIYDVKRQGLTNDTPAADWYLKDFSGNGYDMQLYNYLQAENSGIGKYGTNYTKWTKVAGIIITKNKIVVTKDFVSQYWLCFTYSDVPAYKVRVSGIPEGCTLRYQEQTLVNGINELHALEGITSAEGFTVNNIGNVFDLSNLVIEQIPDYEGALVSDGKDDYGQFVGDLGLKDYTIAVDRAYVEDLGTQVPIVSSIGTTVNTPFLMEHIGVGKILSPHSFGTYTALSILNTDRFISYQSTYKYNGDNLTKGTSTDTGSGLTIGRFGANNSQYAKLALWSLLLFPYSLSEFLLERQLKKYKLGTLYPDMVEFRPVISGNIPYNAIEISQGSTVLYNKSINKTGIYLQEGSTVRVYIQPSGIDEVSKITVNGVEYTDLPINPNGYYYADFPITKSPQKIDITIDEYIRFEDIVQPYPEIWTITQNGNKVSWGDKLKVGSEFGYNSKVNLLSDVYTTTNSYYNGKVVKEGNILKVEKQMTFACDKTWKLNTTEPHAIYSPQKLNIPNSSLKILGYIPDLTGKGNHGKLNNFAYTEDSGVAADGSIKLDGIEDYITIPNLAHGGKCVMMKVNWSNGGMLYDQRLNSSTYTFGILTSEALPAYNARNNGSTYIDGILNTSIIPSDLVGITHNITAVNDAAIDNNTVSPRLGVSVSNAVFSNQALYEFMLFPEIPSEDEIKKLNDIMGIEGGYVESPNYYWDAYGKKNTDTDRNLIADQVSKDIANALEVKNVGYNSESGYNGYIELLFNKWSVFINENRAEIDKTDTTLNITKVYIQNKAIIYCTIGHYLADIPSKYKITGVDDTHPIKFGNDGFPNELILTVTKDGEYEVDWYNYGKNPCIMAGFIGDCNITIEQVAQYPNGLLLDGVDDHAVNTVIPAVTDFTVIAKREFPESTLVNNQTFLVKGDAINGNNNINSLLMECYYGAQNYIISFSHQQIVPLEESKISWITPTSYNGNALTKGSGVDSVGLTIGRYRDLYRKAVFYKAMFYTKTIDQLSINMLKNLFERDELIDVTNPIFKKKEL